MIDFEHFLPGAAELHNLQPSSFNPFIYAFTALIVTFTGLYLYLWTYREWALPFKNLPGPKSDNWFFGNIGAILSSEPGQKHDKWSKEFGVAFRYHMLFGNHRVSFVDPTSINFILSHHDQFPKPELTRRLLVDMAGNGVLVAEGADHRRQRRVLNPSFSTQSIRDVLPIFYDKAMELREKLLGLTEEDINGDAAPTPAKKEDMVPGGRKVDVMKYLGQASVDIIGLAGFNYDFKALSQPSNELADAFTKMINAAQTFSAMSIIQAYVPGAAFIPTKRTTTMKMARKVTQRIGRRLIEEKKWTIQQAHSDGIEKSDDIGKDILSSCIRANLAADLKPEHRLSDDEVLAQITTFMLAGNETSSTSVIWLLYMLAKHPEVQNRLRKECGEVKEERPSLEDISALPYLGAVVHEGLRLLSPVQATERMANEDVVIPFGTPVKGRDGVMMDHIKLPKGTEILIPIGVINSSETIWGTDAKSFNPSRHLSPEQGGTMIDKELLARQNSVKGVWGNILTFHGGSRNCIGYRFAIAEIKIILFVLMRGLEFEELPSKPKISRKSGIVMRPHVVGEEKFGFQMPLILKPLAQS